MKIIDYFKKNWASAEKVTKSGKRADSSKKEDMNVDFKLILDFFRKDPIISSAVWVTVDNVVAGYDIVPIDDSTTSENEAEEAKKILEEDNTNDKLRNIVANIVLFSNSYEEVQTYLENGQLKLETYMLDTPSIKINFNKDGTIKQYEQYLNGKCVAKLDPKDIVHYKINTIGDRDLGLSLVETVMFSSAMRKFAEKYNSAIMQNHKPRGAWIFSDSMDADTYNDNVDLIVEAKSNPNKDIFLRGNKEQIEFKPFLQQNDIGFTEAMKSSRDEIITGMMVPPILLGIPESSNRANSDIQLQGFDRRIKSIQDKINKQFTEEILKKKLNMMNVEFRLKKSNKRDEERELNIVNKMAGLVTLNEAREQLGLPELDEEAFPNANQIWSNSNPTTAPVEDGFQKDYKKTVNEIKVKPKLKEKETIALLEGTIEEVKKVVMRRVMNSDAFSKAIKNRQVDPADLSFNLDAIIETASANFVNMIKEQYIKGNDDISTKLNINTTLNQDEVKFLQNYALDLIKGMTDDMLSKIKGTLRRGVMDGLSINEVAKEVESITNRTKANSQTIARTELSRVNNMGNLNAMKDSGIKAKKYIIITEDNRTTDVSKAFKRKYGTPSQAIDLDEEFKVTVKGKLYKGLTPPFMPNDRDTVVFTTD